MVKIESDLQGGGNGYAWGVNVDGSVVVGQDDIVLGGEFNLGQFCLRWESYGAGIPGGFPELFQSELPNPLDMDCGAFGISDDGSTVVGWTYGEFGQEAFRRTVGPGGSPTMEGLGDLAGGTFRSIAFDASADGSTIVGFSNSAIGEEAFLWTSGGGMVSIGVGRASGITPMA